MLMRNRIRSISLKLIVLVFFSIAIISIGQKNKISATDAVAQINQTPYTSIDEAFSAANTMEDCTLVLLQDISIDTDYYLEVTGKFQLDLNGHTIFKFFDSTYQTYQILVVNNNLTIIDSIGSGNITATGMIQDCGCLIENKGTLNVYAGIFNSDCPSFYGIWNNGSTTTCSNIYDATFQIDEGSGVMNSTGTLNMYGGTIRSKYGIQNASNVMIYEGTIHGLETAVSNLKNGIFDFYGGTISSDQYSVQNYGIFSIYGGIIENESNVCCVDNLDEAALFNQYGGSILGFFNIGLNNSLGIINIYGGSTSGQPAIYCRGVTNIYGGDVYSSGTNTNSLIVDAGTINIYGGRISNNFIIETGTIQAYGGYFQNNSIALGTDFVYKETSDSNFKYEVVNQKSDTEVILISSNGNLTYCSLAEAIANADDHSKIRLLNSKIINNTIQIDKTIILLTNGKTVSCTDNTVFNITETGKLFLTDDKGLNGNDMIVGGGTATIHNAGEMYFSGGTIKGINGIYNTGSLYVCAGEVISDNDALIVADGVAAILAGSFTSNTGLHLLSAGYILIAGSPELKSLVDIQIESNMPQTKDEVRLEIFGCASNEPYCISYLEFTNDGYIAFCDHTSIGKITLSNESYGVLYDYQNVCAKVVSSEAKINNNIYGSIEVAIAEANKLNNNTIVQLLADVVIEEPLRITGTVTLDLNNHSLSSSTNCIEIDSYAVLNIVDSAEIKTSKVIGNQEYSIVGGAIVGDLAIVVNSIGNLNMNAGNLIGNVQAVHNRGGAISLAGGELFAQQIGIQNESGTIGIESAIIHVGQTDIVIKQLVSNQLKDAILDLSHYTGNALTLKIETITNNYYIAKCEEQLKNILVWENENYVPWYTLGGIKIHSHQYGDEGVITPPTCISTGYTTFTCSECNEQLQKNEVPKTSHDLTHFDLQDATCTENGYMEYWYCSFCKYNYSDAECSSIATDLVIPAKGHDHNTEPTWEWVGFEQATASFKCSRCDSIKFFTTTDISKNMKASPSCTKVGEWEYMATIIFNDQEYYSYKIEEIPLLNHDVTNVEPTWEWAIDFSSATAIFKCLNCDYVERIVSEQEIIQLSYEQPDCVNTGKRTYSVTIEFNQQTYTDEAEEIISAYGHKYENYKPTWEWVGFEQASATFICNVCHDKNKITTKESDIVNYITIPSSCTSTGLRTYKASIDYGNRGYSDTKTEELPALGHHTEHHLYQDATCTEEGNQEYWYCDQCQKYFKDESFIEEYDNITISAKGHDYTDVLPTWQWAETAIATFQCNRCSYSEIIKATPAEITYEITRSATCIEEGIKTYTATISFAGKQYKDTNTEILPCISHHLAYHEPIEATCTKEGNVEYWYCDQCQKYYNSGTAKQEITNIIVPMKEHDYTVPTWEWTGYEKAVATFVCSQCNHENQIIVANTDITSKITRSASCTETGIKIYSAQIIFKKDSYINTVTETLPIIEHNYTNVTPIWKWSENHMAQATFKCLNCSHYETITAQEVDITNTITKEATCQDNGEKSFTASIKFLNAVYSNIHTEIIPVIDHQPSEWIIDEVATTTSTGLKHKSCLMCQTKLENAKIEKLITSEDGTTSYTDNTEGKVTKTVIIIDALPPTELMNDVSLLRQVLLSTEDEKRISNGEDVTLYLEVKSGGKKLTATDKENILQSATANAIYLDISLNKKINSDVSELENIGQMLQIKLVIPTSIRAQDRNYRLVHYHDGVAEVVDCSINKENWTIEFETDDFSIFAIVYEDEKNASFIIFICTIIFWSLALIGIGYIFIFEKNHSFQNSTLTPMIAPIIMIPTSLSVAFGVGIGVFIVVWGYILYLHLQNRKFLKSTKEEQKEPTELPIKEDVGEKPSDASTSQIVYRKSFLALLLQGNEETKQIYNELKNEFLAYDNIHTVLSDNSEIILFGKKRIALFTLNEAVLQLYLALDSEEVMNDYPALMIGHIKDNEYFSCSIMVEDQSDLPQVKAIITNLMQSLDSTVQLEYQHQDFISLYPDVSNDALIEKGFIKVDISAIIKQTIDVEESNQMISDIVAESLIEQVEVSNYCNGELEMVYLDTLVDNFQANDHITIEELRTKGLVKEDSVGFEVLARGIIDKPLYIEAQAFSIDSVKMIVLTGGRVIKTIPSNNLEENTD